MGGVKVATTCLHWSHYQSTSSTTHNLSPTISPRSSPRKRNKGNQSLVCRVVQAPYRSNVFQTSSPSSTLLRTQSCELPKSRNQTLRRAMSTSSDGFSDEEFQRELQELALKFPVWDDKDENDEKSNEEGKDGEEKTLILSSSRDEKGESSINNRGEGSLEINKVRNSRFFPSLRVDSFETPWRGMRPDPPEWPGMRDIIPASIELKANSVNIPFSLRILRRKSQWKEGFREAGESAYCSVKKAFSSMVFMIRELQSYSLQMREVLFYEDLQGILVRVQKEMNASFVWLFQQIFSHTPTLMVSVMILLANFTVHSMAQNIALAAPPVANPYGAVTEIVSMKEDATAESQPEYEAPAAKMTIIGGNQGGGGDDVGTVSSSGTDGEDGRFNGVSSFTQHEIVSDEISKVTPTPTPAETEAESGNRGVMNDEERKIWNSVMEEALRMQAVFRDESLDIETTKRFVSPVKVDIEPEDYSVYSRTELLYREAVSREPNNSTILSNFAQFLYLVVHDHDRAEEYFKKATRIEPADAEALGRYAAFLWMARKDIGAAEETYIEAMEADPGNTFHAGNYANFLWNTGGEDTCYPLSSPNEECEA